MFSVTRMLIGIGIYIAYLLGIIFLFAAQNTTLYIILLFLGVGALLVAVYTGFLTTPRNYKHLLRDGVDADATIMNISDSYMTVNNQPYVNLDLRVEPKDAPAYETHVGTLVSRLAIPRAGERILVKYDPKKPQNVVLM